jgi:hypothetical protein
MAQSLVFTHAFDFYYKWIPTGSSAITNISWSQHYVLGNGPNRAMSGSWYNFPPFSVPAATGSILTRHTSSITTKDGALAWGSAAGDLLWNVLTPSMSYSQTNDGIIYYTKYRFTYNSESFLRKEFLPTLQLGVLTYPITSSWIAYEPRMIKYASGSTSTGYMVGGTFASFPADVLNPGDTVYSLPSAYTPPTTTYPRVGKNPTNITYGNNSTGSNDGRFFDLAGGCGITRASISASLVQFAASASGISNSEIAVCSAALKKRRLFFPTISTSSSSLATNNPSSWVRLALGKSSNQFFTENGGIYNVKFTLKRDITYDYYPDETQGSELLVYIHNVNAQVPSPSNRILGKNGWYPPEANIVRIKNTPAMAFENPDTGYKLETFNINVVQYGFPAQLVFEASGSLANDGYFGCIIDDVEFCKVGVTTDPGLIKPLNFVDKNTPELLAATKGDVAQPPTPLTGEQQVLLDLATAAKDTAQGFATEAASSATTAGNALIAVNQASGSAKDEINSARDAGVLAVNQASGSAKTDITSAKDTAITAIYVVSSSVSSSIAGFVVQAKDFKDTASSFATAAQASASAASGFKDTASSFATAAQASASLAKGFATAAQASASAAATSATSADTAAISANTDSFAASGYATTATTQATLAKGFATSASLSASSAASYATDAFTQATSAKGFATAAQASASAAATSAEDAGGYATAAQASASAAATSATTATTQATRATNSAVSSSKSSVTASLFAYSSSVYMSQSFAYASQSWSTVKGTTQALYSPSVVSAIAATISQASASYATEARVK